jgi:hypothetical protein
LTSLFVDADRALEVYHRATRGSADWLERVETEIFLKAVQSQLGAADVSKPEDVDRYFGSLWEGRRWLFEPRGEWMPNGVVRVISRIAGLEVRIGGAAVGTSVEGALEIDGVAVGTHDVTVRDPRERFLPFASQAVVEERAATEVRVAMVPRPSPASSARQVTAWSGVGLMAGGAALVTVALLADSSVAQLGGRSRFITFGELGSADEPFPPEPGGPLVAPLGYSLMLTGAVLSFGTWFVGDEYDGPWWQLLVAAALGVVSYGASALAN